MNSDQLILRETDNLPLINKDDVLTNADLDGNLTEAEQDDLIAHFTRSNKHEPGKLPDLRGRFLRGMDKGAGNDPNSGSRTGGNVLGSIQGDEFKSHDHTGAANDNGSHRHTGTTDSGGSSGSERASNANIDTKQVGGDSGGHAHSFTTDYAGTHGHTLTINSTGGAETRPKNVYVNYIIKCVK
jgi:hypothetical protein